MEALRDKLGLPGMKVLQFAFSGPENPHLPHNYAGENWAAYTGTHDNDTTAGWWAKASEEEQRFARRSLGREYAGVWTSSGSPSPRSPVAPSSRCRTFWVLAPKPA